MLTVCVNKTQKLFGKTESGHMRKGQSLWSGLNSFQAPEDRVPEICNSWNPGDEEACRPCQREATSSGEEGHLAAGIVWAPEPAGHGLPRAPSALTFLAALDGRLLGEQRAAQTLEQGKPGAGWQQHRKCLPATPDLSPLVIFPLDKMSEADRR